VSLTPGHLFVNRSRPAAVYESEVLMAEKEKIEKLTKAFLMEQKQGAFIASNVTKDRPSRSGKPVFAEEVGRPDNRHAQWERIKKARAANRLCHVFASKQDYLEFEKLPEPEKYELKRTLGLIRQTKELQQDYEKARADGTLTEPIGFLE